MSQLDTQLVSDGEDEQLEFMESLLKEVEKPMEQWATQEDMDCPGCMQRYYLCVCHRLPCDCHKCQEID